MNDFKKMKETLLQSSTLKDPLAKRMLVESLVETYRYYLTCMGEKQAGELSIDVARTLPRIYSEIKKAFDQLGLVALEDEDGGFI